MMDVRERFTQLVKDAGYPSLRQFAFVAGITPQNLNERLLGRYKLSLRNAYHFANALCVSVDEVVRIFEPELVKVNKENVANGMFTSPEGKMFTYSDMKTYCAENFDYGDETNAITYMSEWYKEYGFHRMEKE